MCITFFAQYGAKSGRQFPFAIAFNRDEFVTRAALPLQYLTNNILCGIDKETGTTWFAVNKATGDFACLTNFRTRRNHEQPRDYQTRGFLVTEHVKMNDPTIKDKLSKHEYDQKLRSEVFRGFNLVSGNLRDQLSYCQMRNIIGEVAPD